MRVFEFQNLDDDKGAMRCIFRLTPERTSGDQSKAVRTGDVEYVDQMDSRRSDPTRL